MKYVQQPSSGLPTQLPLDFSVRTTEGTVVPQRRWSLVNEVDIRLHVQGAALQLPVFFVDRNGSVGFWLPDILEGRDRELYNRDIQAPLGGKTTTPGGLLEPRPPPGAVFPRLKPGQGEA